jgi:hypothetical protein
MTGWLTALSGVFYVGQIYQGVRDAIWTSDIDKYQDKEIKEGPLKQFVDNAVEELEIGRKVTLFVIPKGKDFRVFGCSFSKKLGISIPDDLKLTEQQARFHILHGLTLLKKDVVSTVRFVPAISGIVVAVLINSNFGAAAGFMTFAGTRIMLASSAQRGADTVAYNHSLFFDFQATVRWAKSLSEKVRSVATEDARCLDSRIGYLETEIQKQQRQHESIIAPLKKIQKKCGQILEKASINS